MIINALTNSGESNLVYSSRGDYAEKWALKYSETIKQEDKALEEELRDLIKYIKTDIHPKYYLIPCLEKRVAFHHGSLSEFVRKEIETLFELGIITTLFCTTTLLEGVNLPADNLFVIKPEKNKEDLSDFEFGNLIGRAGRLKNSLFGTIYCVSKNNSTQWAEDYYQANYSKEVITASAKSLPNVSTEDLSKPSTQISETKTKNVVTALRNKALKKDNSLDTFLNKHNLSAEKITTITTLINASIQGTKIPYSVVKQNPTIDPVLQNTLYTAVIEDGYENWVINTKSKNYANRQINKQQDLEIPFKEKNLFWQLNSIISRLNDIFEIKEEIRAKDKFFINVVPMTINTLNWIQGQSLGSIIESRINYYASDKVSDENRIDINNITAINHHIKDVIRINNKVVTFSILKYIKLLVDIVETILNDEEKENYKLTLSLPSAIELGSQEGIIILLISNGIPRTISIKLFEQFKKTTEYKNDLNIFDWMKKQTQITGLEPIYNKFLIKNNFIASTNGL